MKKILLFLVCILLTIGSYAKTVIKLKDGNTVEGEIIEKTDKYIKILVSDIDVALSYWMTDIESIKSAKTTPIDSKELGRIKKVWETFLKGFINKDLSSMTKTISPNYSVVISDNKTMNYKQFLSQIDKWIVDFSKTYSRCSENPKIEITKANIKNNKANIVVKYKLRCFNIDKKCWSNYEQRRKVNFYKKDGKWKIIGIYSDMEL